MAVFPAGESITIDDLKEVAQTFKLYLEGVVIKKSNTLNGNKVK